jgi:hypothetical protein
VVKENLVREEKWDTRETEEIRDQGAKEEGG